MSDVAISTARTGAVNLAAGYSSIRADTPEAKRVVFNAISDPVQLSDVLGAEIDVENVITLPATSTDEASGAVSEFTRIILIDTAGKAYAAGSSGLFIALNNLFAVYGPADSWAEPVKVRVVKRKGNGKNRDYFTIELP